MRSAFVRLLFFCKSVSLPGPAGSAAGMTEQKRIVFHCNSVLPAAGAAAVPAFGVLA